MAVIAAEAAAPSDPRARRVQRVRVLAVGESAAALAQRIEATAAVRIEQVAPADLLHRLRTFADGKTAEADSVLVLVHHGQDMRDLAAGEERWHRAGPLVTTIFVHDAADPATHDGHWTLDGNLMLLRATSDQLVITGDRDYPAEVVRALTQ